MEEGGGGASKTATALLFLAICLFALSSWVDINGLWTEVPLLVGQLPEGWDLPSYLVVIVQVANVGPLCYIVVKKLKPNVVKEWIATCSIIIIGIVSSFVLIFTWDRTSYIGGELHSTYLLVLSFFLAVVDCTSSVVYLPYMARFDSSTFMTALYVGEGLSGLVPALIGLAQIVGTDMQASSGDPGRNSSLNDTTAAAAGQPSPRFSVGVFFAILTILLVISLVSFLFVNFHPYFDRFKSAGASCTGVQVQTADESAAYSEIDAEKNSMNASTSSLSEYNSTSLIVSNSVIVDIQRERSTKDTIKLVLMYLIVILINFLSNGFLPSVQSFACLPYSYLTYDLAVKLSIIANPLACFLTLAFMCRRLSLISIIVGVGTVMAAYQIVLASLSPHPILQEGVAGIVLAVGVVCLYLFQITSSVVMSACFSFAKVCISTVILELGGQKLLLYCGVSTQVGSLLGAITAFLLVNVFD